MATLRGRVKLDKRSVFRYHFGGYLLRHNIPDLADLKGGRMISTVTTTTISTVTTVALGASLGLVAIVALLALLIQKEVVVAAAGPRAKTLGRVLNTAIVPLLITFGAIVFMKVAEVLR